MWGLSVNLCTGALGLLLGWHWFRGRRRPLVLALVFALFVAWLGQAGNLPYLGVTAISPSATAGPLVAVLTASMTNFLQPGKEAVRLNAAIRTPPVGAAYACAVIGIALMARRFQEFGIPLLGQSRFAGVGGVSPQAALLTAMCLLLAVGIFGARPARLALWERLAAASVFLIVFASASRLLILAAVMAFVVARFTSGPWQISRGKLIPVLGAVALIAGVALPFIYSARATQADGTAALSQVATVQAGEARPVVHALGPGAYVSARNGAAVATRVLASGVEPPHGYIGAAAFHVLGAFTRQKISGDPEIFLTQAVFGFDPTVVGATAFPLASAAQADYGLIGSIILGIIVVAGYDAAGRRGPVASAWWAFGVALSSYGMYLLSLQFVAVLLGFLIFGIGSHRSLAPRDRMAGTPVSEAVL